MKGRRFIRCTQCGQWRAAGRMLFLHYAKHHPTALKAWKMPRAVAHTTTKHHKPGPYQKTRRA